ncbi:hypothetical protein CHARACLAT_019857 [Characodon lateralis]|uniref:Uncharacterized protein n=1 Tax=Characodon lateralis TaxID=208331 RepID=A0ABU7ECJ0_9TELE|nr:hypothetical protein [Characodon lateralis]
MQVIQATIVEKDFHGKSDFCYCNKQTEKYQDESVNSRLPSDRRAPWVGSLFALIPLMILCWKSPQLRNPDHLRDVFWDKK